MCCLCSSSRAITSMSPLPGVPFLPSFPEGERISASQFSHHFLIATASSMRHTPNIPHKTSQIIINPDYIQKKNWDGGPCHCLSLTQSLPPSLSVSAYFKFQTYFDSSQKLFYAKQKLKVLIWQTEALAKLCLWGETTGDEGNGVCEAQCSHGGGGRESLETFKWQNVWKK